MKFAVCLEKRIVIHVEAASAFEAQELVLEEEDREGNQQEWDKAEAVATETWEK